MKQIRQFILFILLVITLSIFLFSSFPSIIKTLSILIYLLILFSVSFVLMLENRSPYKTLLWIYALFFFPIIGYIFFIYSGQLEVKGHLFKQKREHDKKLMQDTEPYKPSPKWDHLREAEQSFSKLIETLSQNSISFYSKTKVLKNGDETFPAIIDALNKAKKYIHLEYYTFKSDQIGMELIKILCEKAKTGVEIRFIYDAIGSVGLSKSAVDKMREAGVNVHCFLPVKHGFFNQKLNFRNHRKIVVIDGKIGFVGGLNVGDEYLGNNPKIGFWRDTHLCLEGEALTSLHATFLLDWAYVSDENLFTSKYMAVERAEGDGGIQIVSSGPDSSQGVMSNLYYSMITTAKKSIWIATPYFVPNKALRTALEMAAARGVEIKLIVPQINDGFLTQYATRSYFPELLRNDIEVYMYCKGFLHGKIMIIDGQMASVGTANMDLRSLHLNFEINAFLFHTESIKELINHYMEDLGECEKVDKKRYHNRGLLVRTKESFARLFSPVL
ncbi:cardiolipin synthase [Metabacillus arenae]|uniref:Cardiolipin synthase n=1 Tax=Metabacillus arenae TaxID=2771434 RepID=A0A926NC01_9BACI|nr:cardiolipin synthase [Metabacillus arenae]MBD1380729.1 cardiolipin synthase [Metabacillus arenae]